ncbi:hypothetical protein [Clostridium perfringens]|uniref:hypothetical protein n=1 Tax=Clostridium perfringens TaxID=1502 RepID=UPI0023418FEE|nr:hypothetical protein [Clostridium perfringens]MDC4245689.1 hypothetical protein [Clostridium perfringens]
MSRLTIRKLETFKGYPRFVKYHVLQLSDINESESAIKNYFLSKSINLINEFNEIDLLTCDKKYLLDLCKQSSLLYFSFKYYRDKYRKGCDCTWEEIKDINEKLRDSLGIV